MRMNLIKTVRQAVKSPKNVRLKRKKYTSAPMAEQMIMYTLTSPFPGAIER